MAPQFPLFRLATLLARQLSSPVAARIKMLAVRHPRLGRAVCMGAGRAYYVLQLRMRLWMLALRQPRALPAISDQSALDTGADILGEVAVFGLGGLIVMFEVNRQANKQEDKVLEDKSRWLVILVSLEELQRELELQQQDIDRLQGSLRRLAPHHYRTTPPVHAPPALAPPAHVPPAPPAPPASESCEPPPACELESIPQLSDECDPPESEDISPVSEESECDEDM